jgi:penicillin-binding protein 2
MEARRRAEAARLAALARQRAVEEAMRGRVQSMIAKDDTAGEDPEIRRVAVNALGNHAGTVVVMNPTTGHVYSMVNQEWALREGFKPCSTIKLVTGLAGLNEKVINPVDTTAISESNRVTLTSALAHSKNEYFQTVGGQVGFTKMISYARQLGLGEKTGINVRNEFAGSVPAFKSGFAVNHMSSHGDDFKVTPIQLVTLVSAMANGGKLLTPIISRASRDETSLQPKIRRSINFDPETWRDMVPGMVGSVSYGSGHKAFDPVETVAGKTGTCLEHGTWVGLFASYAPLKDPKLAIVVIARGSDGRSHFPAAVAGRIYRDLNGRFGTPTNLQIASRDSKLTNGNAVTETSAAEEKDVAGDDDESDDVNENGATTSKNIVPEKPPSSRQVWPVQTSPRDSRVKPTVMALPKRTAEIARPADVSKAPAKSNPATLVRPRRVTNLRK